MAHQSIDQMLGKVLYVGLEHDLLWNMLLSDAVTAQDINWLNIPVQCTLYVLL